MTHEAEHVRIARDVDRFRAIPPRRSTVGLHRRREAYKKAVLAVRWHLSKSHGFRRTVGVPLTLDQLETIHARYHEDQPMTDGTDTQEEITWHGETFAVDVTHATATSPAARRIVWRDGDERYGPHAVYAFGPRPKQPAWVDIPPLGGVATTPADAFRYACAVQWLAGIAPLLEGPTR